MRFSSQHKNDMRKNAQIIKIKTDLQTSFSEVRKISEGKIKKQTLSSFLKSL